MTTTEYGLLALVILAPLAIAVMVTLWSLEQARMRTKKNRKQTDRKREAETDGDGAPSAS